MLSISVLRKPPEINPMDTNTSYNQEIVYYQKGEYDRAWEDAPKAQSLGHQVHPEFFKALREEVISFEKQASVTSKQYCQFVRRNTILAI